MVKNKLNNRGYVLMEIIMASMIAFGVVYYILDLTIKLKNKNDDLFIQTVIETDQAIFQKKITKDIIETTFSYGRAFSCTPNPFSVDGKILKFNDGGTLRIIDTVSTYVTIDGSKITCSNDGSTIKIVIPLKAGDKTYYTRINYVIK